MKKHTPDNIGEVTFTTNNSALILWMIEFIALVSEFCIITYYNKPMSKSSWNK